MAEQKGYSIEKRTLKNGETSYRIVVNAGRTSDGKRRKVTKTVKGMTEAQANKEARQFEQETKKNRSDKGGVANEKRTLAELLKKWLAEYPRSKIEDRTRLNYESFLTNYIIEPHKSLSKDVPRIGNSLIKDLESNDFEQFYDSLMGDFVRTDGSKDGLSDTTRLYIHRILKKAFKWARKSGCLKDRMGITYAPMEDVAAPPRNNPIPKALEAKQAAFMLRKAEETQEYWFYVLLWIALVGGFRRGELLALRWSDCDFQKNTIMVDESLYTIRKSKNNGNAKGFKKPKTKSSIGKVYMPQEAMDLLIQWKVKQKQLHDDPEGVGDKWNSEWNETDGLIFTSEFGNAIYPDTITHKFTKFMKDIGLTGYHFHNLRHSTASILFADGKQAKDIQERLRHANVQTTMNIYTELFQSAKERTADDFGKLMTKEIADEAKTEGTIQGTNSPESDLLAPNESQNANKKSKQYQSLH